MSAQPLANARADADFDAIVAEFDRVLRCEMDTAAGRQCSRPAHWRLNLHGCERGLLCGQHLRAWECAAAESSTGRCAHCGHQFAEISDAYTVAPL